MKCSRANILDLESSTEHKFSRHLIFHLPGAVFRNNAHAGGYLKVPSLIPRLPRVFQQPRKVKHTFHLFHVAAKIELGSLEMGLKVPFSTTDFLAVHRYPVSHVVLAWKKLVC